METERVQDKDGHIYNVVTQSCNEHPDTKVANKWRWSWLLEHDHGPSKDMMSSYLCKIDVEGHAFCRWCKIKINYGSSGKKACYLHASKHDDHQKYINAMKNQESLPSTLSTGDSHSVNPNESTASSSVKKSVHIQDRVSHLEAYILSFMCENNLSLSMAPKLTEFGATLHQDPKAFKKLSRKNDVKDCFSRTTATYKIVHGLGSVFHSRVVDAMRTTPFSLNIDECTSKTGVKVFSIIVMYFDRALGKSVFQNYNSISLLKCDAKTIADKIIDMFSKDGIPLKNLTADLSDSAATMRGRHSGVEKRLRDLAPHLLNIGGDTCHDMHRSCKSFAENFLNHCEKLISDVHNDSKWSPDIRDALKDVCLIIDEHFRKPPERTDHRWLSTYDCCVVLLPMMTSLRILYYSFMPYSTVGDKVGKDMYEEEYENLLKEKNVDERGRAAISSISEKMASKSLTEDGIKRKERIYQKLWEVSDKTQLIMQLYDVVYPMFKSFVLVFEQKTPQIHKLYIKLVEVLRQFFSAFVKHELIRKASGKQLKTLKLSERTVRKKDELFYGAKNERLMKKMKGMGRGDIVEEFQDQVLESYILCGKYLQSKVPLDLPVLKCLGAINPMGIGDSSNHKYLKQLGDFFPQILDDDEKLEGYLADINSIQLDNNLPPALEKEVEVQLDIWWNLVMKSGKYQHLSLVVEACLSVFSGPIVEGTFSILNDIMDKKHSSLVTDTYNGILKAKLYQLSTGLSASEGYKRHDPLYSPVDKGVCRSIRLAASRWKKTRNNAQKENKIKLNNISSSATVSKKKVKKRSVHEINNSIKKVMAGTSTNEEELSEASLKNTAGQSATKKTGKKKKTKEPETNSSAINFNINVDEGSSSVVGQSGMEKSGQKRKAKKPEEACTVDDVVVQKCVPPNPKKKIQGTLKTLKTWFTKESM